MSDSTYRDRYRDEGVTSKATEGWKGHAYLLLPAFFSAGLVAYYFSVGSLLVLSPTPLLLLGLPVAGLAGLYRRNARAWMALATICLSYEALAGPIDAVADGSRIFSLFDLDKVLWGFNLTGWVQSAFSSASMTGVMASFYYVLLPLIAMTSVLVWTRNRTSFGKYVTAMLLTSYAALMTFLLIPTAPPWLSGAAKNLVQDSGLGPIGSYLGPLAAFVEPDRFAAFPSLHAAYTVICSYFLLKIGRVSGAVAVVLTAGTLLATLYLGQHYLIDLIAGAAYAIVPCLVSERWQIIGAFLPEVDGAILPSR